MASHLVVIDASARRHTIKTTPGKYLNDVLQEACGKFGVDPNLYGLKHNDKPVDLGRTVQLSGLSPGARLNLIQSSRSAAPVTVALQLPQAAASTPGTRLVDKFPSTTSLWQVLRRFESGVAGGEASAGKNFNFTQRATPLMSDGGNAATDGSSGAGRLCYEMPTLNVMGRQLESITDLSRTLQQLGISGNVMMRLSFKNTMQPLEDAMKTISQYFDDIAEQPLQAVDNITTSTAEPSGPQDPSHISSEPPDTGQANNVPSAETQTLPNSSTTPASPSTADVTVFSAPVGPPSASLSDANTHNDNDYIPTAEHARSHQANLARASRNRRLPTDAEVAQAQKDRDADLAKVQSVTVRLRFPDQMVVQKVYGQSDTLQTLYDTCRSVMDLGAGENIELVAAGMGSGGAVQGAGVGVMERLAEDERKLIRDLGWTGRVLVTVGWTSNVSQERRARPSLRQNYRAQAEQMKVESPNPRVEEKTNGPTAAAVTAGEDDDKGKKKGDKEARLKKLLGFKKG
ncbi:MAG: hypothetical protein Q9162_000734 [Coniocarpon cinnabarinum]